MITPLSHRKRAIPAGREPEVSRTAGWISPVLVVGGAVAWVWEHEVRGDALTITVRGFGSVPAAVRRAAEQHAARYGALLGTGRPSIAWS